MVAQKVASRSKYLMLTKNLLSYKARLNLNVQSADFGEE